MGVYSGGIAVLVGQTILRAEVDDGRAYFYMKDGTMYGISPIWGMPSDGVDLVDGDLQDIVDSPIMDARYSHLTDSYRIISNKGIVTLACTGPRTGFIRE